MAFLTAWTNSRALASAVWRVGLTRVLFLVFVNLFGYAVLVPQLPTVFTNFFASKYAGEQIACEIFKPDESPDACHNAHSEVVDWTSWTSFLSNSLFAFLFAPWLGDLSDVYGRKTFILLSLNINLLPILVVILYQYKVISLIWYYPANAVTGMASAVAMYLAMVADVLQPEFRTAGFGLIVSSFSLAFMFGPLVGTFLTFQQAVWTAFTTASASIIFAVFCIPETLPNCISLRENPNACLHSHFLGGFWKAWSVINRNRLFQKLAFCMAVSGMIGEGIQDLLVQYLQMTVGFGPKDQGLLFTLIGAGNLLVQSVLLALLAPLLGEQRLLMFGICFSVVEQTLLAFVNTKAMAFAAVSIGSLAGVAWPAISAIKSVNSSAEEQGMVQGALTGIRSLASGVGPLIFARIFAISTRTDSPIGYHPGTVFYVSAGMTVISLLVAASIDKDAGTGKYRLLPPDSDTTETVAKDPSSVGHV